MDRLTPEQRKRNMRNVRTGNTDIELLLRRALWKKGIRYRIANKDVIGSPDICIRKYRLAVFCDGDFWHGNPKIYNENDILNFSKTNHPKVKDIWKKDEKNRNFAEKNGYKIIYLWENDITNKNDIELGKFLIDILNK